MVEQVTLNHKVPRPNRGRLAMNITKANNRDKKRLKRNKMVVDSKSVFIIQQAIIKRGSYLPVEKKPDSQSGNLGSIPSKSTKLP